MNKNLKFLKISIITIFVFIGICFIFLKLDKIGMRESKVKYTVEWKLKKGILTLNKDEILYNKDNQRIVPTSEDMDNSYYDLNEGVYKLKTKTVQNEPTEIKVIIY